MTDRIVIQVDDDKAQRWFSELMQRSSDMSGLMAEIGGVLTESAQDRFKTGTAPDGTRWAPLKDGSGRRPLLKTGTMRDQIAPTSGAAFVEIVASAKQARWHQEGTGPYVIRPKGKALKIPGIGWRKYAKHPGLPARRFIGLSRLDEEGIDRLAAEWLDPPAS